MADDDILDNLSPLVPPDKTPAENPVATPDTAEVPDVFNPQDEDGFPVAPLLRSQTDTVLGGVCAGIAHRYGLPVAMVRVLWVAAFLTLGLFPLLAYFVIWAMLPDTELNHPDRYLRVILLILILAALLAAIGFVVWGTEPHHYHWR